MMLRFVVEEKAHYASVSNDDAEQELTGIFMSGLFDRYARGAKYFYESRRSIVGYRHPRCRQFQQQ
jgi:hypothetical protein